MKKVTSMFLIVIFMFVLSACNADAITIEDYEWKMRTVMSNKLDAAQKQDELVIAVGEADELYPDAEIVDLTLIAKDGEITITNFISIFTCPESLDFTDFLPFSLFCLHPFFLTGGSKIFKQVYCVYQ